MMVMFGGLILCNLVFAAPTPVTSVTKDDSGVSFAMTPGAMRIDVCTESILRVRYSTQSTIPNDANMNFLVEKRWTNVAFTQDQTDAEYTITTSKVQVKVNKTTGAVSFYDAGGTAVLQELTTGGKSITPATINGQSTNTCEQAWQSPEDEAIYGLGSFHDGIINYRGIPEYLDQNNTHISIPVIISSKGYGILWANASRTFFNKPEKQITTSGSGQFTTTEAGEYVFMTLGGPQGTYNLNVNGTVLNSFSSQWHGDCMGGKITLPANTAVSVTSQSGVTIWGGKLQNETKFTSRSGQTIDYYFLYGPTPDEVIAGYRLTTGTATLLPRRNYGFIQCKAQYGSQKEILDAAYQFRNRKIPVDVIVQDWQYWTGSNWGSMEFDPARYNNPKQMIDSLHKLNYLYMISCWSKVSGSSALNTALQPYKISGTDFYDAFNPAARSKYWEHMNNNLFSIGTDAFWQDSDEPEELNLESKNVNFGSGAVGAMTYANAYPLFVCKTVADGWRSTNSPKRVSILSRSAFPGCQRYGAMCWNGDIGSDWSWFQKSVRAGLNFCMTGMPYWSTDIGGFFRPGNDQTDAGFNELLSRWIAYGAFCPLFRIHGYNSHTEIWNYTTAAQNTLMIYDNLRYRLFPYIYSLAGMVNRNGYTMMRGLVMDFQKDTKVFNIGDQFMFGPAFLVNPVLSAGANSRSVYLPTGTTWYNFWTGEAQTGGQTISARAPRDTIPLFVRAGSIIPMGPFLQHSSEKKADTIELRVYPGANGSFTIYEDEGDNNNYENGKYSLIPISYIDNQKKVVMGQRIGSFTGMDQKKVFRVVFVGNNHGTGVGVTTTADTQIVYNGDGVSIANIRTVVVNTIAPKAFTKTVIGNIIALPVTFSGEMKNIAVYDCSGKLLRSLNVKKNVFDLRKDFNLPTGMYIVKAHVLKSVRTK
jgi:alpha-D-xyloside xylohydrolase